LIQLNLAEIGGRKHHHAASCASPASWSPRPSEAETGFSRKEAICDARRSLSFSWVSSWVSSWPFPAGRRHAWTAVQHLVRRMFPLWSRSSRSRSPLPASSTRSSRPRCRCTIPTLRRLRSGWSSTGQGFREDHRSQPRLLDRAPRDGLFRRSAAGGGSIGAAPGNALASSIAKSSVVSRRFQLLADGRGDRGPR
jgi:hypothetical protein